MKLSMSIIGRALAHHDPEYHIQEDTLSIRGVRFLSDMSQQSSREFVYIGAASGYFQDPRYADALILANGPNHILCRGSEYEELLNEVLGVFDTCNALEQRLTTLAAHGRPLEEMMTAAGELLRDCFLVFALDGSLLAVSHLDRLPDQRLLENIRTMRNIGSSAIGNILVDRQGRVSHDLTDQPQYLHPADTPEVGSVSMYLRREGERVGFLMYFASGEQEIDLGICLEPVLAGFLAEAAEFTALASPHQANRSILQQLLDGVSLSPEVVRKPAEHIRMGSAACLMVFQSRAIQNHTMRQVLMDELEGSGIPCLTCQREEKVVILTDESRVADMIARLGRQLPESNLSLGISMPVQRLELLTVAWRQALFALNAGEGPGIRTCRDLALPWLLQCLRREDMTPDLVHPALKALEKYDADTGAELLPTLREYVLSGCRQAETAERLHVHLNTLKYRLRRIEELTGADFRDPEEVFYLRLSMALQ